MNGRWPRARIAMVIVAGVIASTLAAVLTTAGGARAAINPGCVVDLADTVAWWRGEDDLTGEIGPTAVGTVGFADGFVGRGLSFDGTNLVSVDAFPTVSSGVAVEAWVKPTTNGLVQALLSRWDAPGPDDSARTFTLLLAPSGALSWQTDETSTRRPEDLEALVPQIFDGAFHHVVATWNATTITVYFDGVAVATNTSQAGVLNPATSTQLRIGSQAGLGSPLFFTGVLDEPTIWSRALSASEVAAIYGAGAAGKCTFVPMQLQRITANFPAGNATFGQAVSVKGPDLAVGSAQANIFTGSVDVSVRVGNLWYLQATVVADDRHVTDFFGSSVAISGDTLVVGSPGSSPLGSDSGAVYVFTRSAGVWTQQAKIFPSDGATTDQFGDSVDIDGDTIVVGADLDDDAGANSGSAYVFTRTAGVWTQQAKLVPGDGAADDAFGLSLALHGDTAIIGSPGHDANGVNSGAAYVFTRTAGVWTQQALIGPADPAAGDQFGRGVDLDVDSAIVGAPLSDGTGLDSGSAYVFTRSASAWTQQAKLVATDASAGDDFGHAVGLSGANAVIGARGVNGAASHSGAAYVFTRGGTVWSQLAKLEAIDAVAGDQLGTTVAVSGPTFVVGAPTADDFGNNSGAAYLFAR